jgi:hypothetical protein
VATPLVPDIEAISAPASLPRHPRPQNHANAQRARCSLIRSIIRARPVVRSSARPARSAARLLLRPLARSFAWPPFARSPASLLGAVLVLPRYMLSVAIVSVATAIPSHVLSRHISSRPVSSRPAMPVLVHGIASVAIAISSNGLATRWPAIRLRVHIPCPRRALAAHVLCPHRALTSSHLFPWFATWSHAVTPRYTRHPNSLGGSRFSRHLSFRSRGRPSLYRQAVTDAYLLSGLCSCVSARIQYVGSQSRIYTSSD